MSQIWLHIREQSSTDDRRHIHQAVCSMEACGLVAFDGDWYEQRRMRVLEGRVSELPLHTKSPVQVQAYLRKAVGDTCWVERQASAF